MQSLGDLTFRFFDEIIYLTFISCMATSKIKCVKGYVLIICIREILLFRILGLMFFVPFPFVIFNLPSYNMMVSNFEVSTILLPLKTH